MRRAVLVNGVPASGKSTVSNHLVRHLISRQIAAVPLSLDTVKEGLFAHIGTGDRDHNRMLGRASYHSIFASIAAFPDSLVPVIDAWHGFQPEAVLRAHLARAEIALVVEVWCMVTPATAAQRYRKRAATRHSGHLPASYADELFTLAGCAEPVGIGPVVGIDTEAPIDPSRLDAVAECLQTDPADHGRFAETSNRPKRSEDR
ncbi:MAG: AAA family ATPase [Pseudomonadota bacterium]